MGKLLFTTQKPWTLRPDNRELEYKEWLTEVKERKKRINRKIYLKHKADREAERLLEKRIKRNIERYNEKAKRILVQEEAR